MASVYAGRSVLSKRFVEKVLSVIPKYYRYLNDLNMLACSTTILYDDQKQSGDKII
jgi:hypothetical protein